VASHDRRSFRISRLSDVSGEQYTPNAPSYAGHPDTCASEEGDRRLSRSDTARTSRARRALSALSHYDQ